MARIPSSTTLYLSAHLTENGRGYFFGVNNSGTFVRFDSNGNDLFKITQFSVYDNNVNYNSVQQLQSGDVPDISGNNGDCCQRNYGLTTINSNNNIYF